jgi:MFS family permease
MCRPPQDIDINSGRVVPAAYIISPGIKERSRDMFESQQAFAIFSIIVGIIVCFWGYRLFKVVLGIAGFIAGAVLFYYFGAQYTERMIVLVILTIFGGLIGASLSLAFYYVGLFLLGALAGWQLGFLIATAINIEFVIIIPIIAAIIAGFLACFFQKPVIIIATALIGAWSVVTGGFYFFGTGIIPTDLFRDPFMLVESLRETNPVVILAWIVLSIAGMIFQFSSRLPGMAGGKEK